MKHLVLSVMALFLSFASFALTGAIMGSTVICAGTTTTLTDATTGGTWSSGTTTVVTIGGTTGVITGIGAGTSTITYTTSGGTVTQVITVNPAPSNITGVNMVCQGDSIQLTDASAACSWSSSSVAIATVGSTGSVKGISANTVIISYTFIATGCATEYEITVLPLPSVIGGGAGICLGSTISISDSTVGGTWSASPTSVVTIINPAIGEATGSAVGTAAITYTSNLGCLRTEHVTVNPLPPIDTISGGGSYCAGGAGVHVYMHPSSVGDSYLLYYGSSVSGYFAGTGGVIDFGPQTVADTFTIKATDNTTGCKSTMYGSVMVSILPTVNPIAAVASNMGDTVCAGTMVTFATTITAPGAASYKWYVNGTIVSIADSTYSFIPASGDSIWCIVTTTDPCVSDSVATSNVIGMVITAPTIPTVTLSAPPLVAVGTIVTVNATVAHTGSSYRIDWDNNGAPFATTTTPVLTYTKAAGTDHITATVVPTSLGCYDSTTSAVLIVNSFTAGINNVSVSQTDIYPNPAHTAITITPAEDITSLTITNLLGQTVYTQQYNAQTIQVNVSDFPTGVYFVKVNGVEVRKFLKE